MELCNKHVVFKDGYIECDEFDFHSRQASLIFSLPCIIFQTVSPILLGIGKLDNFKIKEPIVAWVPKLSKDRLSEKAELVLPNSEQQLNEILLSSVYQSLDVFQKFSSLVKDPADLISILPLGVYVNVRCRCPVNSIINAIVELQKLPIDGVHDVQWALSSVYAWILSEIEFFSSNPRLFKGVSHT